jgi:hypothetical protein
MNDKPNDSWDNVSEDVDQQIRINELREAAREATGGEMSEWESADVPPGIAEQFWGNVLAYETAGEMCHFTQLQELGIELPAPDKLNDDELSAKLWEVIHGLARLNVFLSQTDHLSDRELYAHLWHDSLREITAGLPPNSGWTCHLDLISSGSDEDNELYLKYYADDEYRQRWHKDFPDETIPPHVDPPYSRDCNLPKATQR